jgi:hypothetical protein
MKRIVLLSDVAPRRTAVNKSLGIAKADVKRLAKHGD